MPKFRVRLNGQNFLLSVDGQPRRMGFYKTYFLQADDAEAAELMACDFVRGDDQLRPRVLNEPGDRPLILPTAIDEIESFEGLTSLEQGYVFYPEEEKS